MVNLKNITNKLCRDSEVYIITDDISKKSLDVISFDLEDKTIKSKIVSVKTFTNLEEILEFVDVKNFGDFNSKSDVLKKYSKYKDITPLKLCKLKKEIDDEIVIDDEILNLLDQSIENEQIKIGFSSTKILKVQLKTGKKAILKINFDLSNQTLKKEYEKIMWLQNKIRCPKIYFWKETNVGQYFLMECMQGENSYMFSGIGRRLGEELKKIHSINISECDFDDIKPEKLLKRALENIETSFSDILSIYPNDTKDSILSFLKENIPTDYVFNHGDYSMPNIIVDKESDDISFIDLGDCGVSTMYYDLYHAIKSLRMNKFDSEIIEFLEGYGLKELNENKIKWMTIVDRALS